jgi:3-oxoacyl-[acyl-carrier protein] reductase
VRRTARIAVVIGGAGVIGSQICQVLALGGARVVVADDDLSTAQATAAGLNGSGHRALALDVRVERSVADLFETVETQFGPVASLVCITGGAPVESGARRLIATTSLDTWTETEALNARAAFLCVREFLRRRTVSGVADGRIVTVASLAALMPGIATDAAYATSEAGVLAITRIASLEGGPLGITVNAIVPGTFDSAAMHASISEAVSFLSSAEARHITGAAIAVDGGAHLCP